MSFSKKYIVGVMGQGNNCPPHIYQAAYELGSLLAQEGWVVLSGGRDVGVMDAVSKGAKAAGGLTVGVIPTKESTISPAVDIPIITDVGFARNNINVITSDVVVSCGMGAGTVSEIALALCAGKQVIMLHALDEAIQLFKRLNPHLIMTAATPEEVVTLIKQLRLK